jgi:hypothetical protein
MLKIPPCELPGQREPGEETFDAQLEFLVFAGRRRIIGAMSTTIDVRKAANQAVDGGEASVFGALFHLNNMGHNYAEPTPRGRFAAKRRRATAFHLNLDPSGRFGSLTEMAECNRSLFEREAL